jgi:hypothetical protein
MKKKVRYVGGKSYTMGKPVKMGRGGVDSTNDVERSLQVTKALITRDRTIENHFRIGYTTVIVDNDDAQMREQLQKVVGRVVRVVIHICKEIKK